MKKTLIFLFCLLFSLSYSSSIFAAEKSFEQKIEAFLEQQNNTEDLEQLNLKLTRVKNKISSKAADINQYLMLWRIDFFQAQTKLRIQQLERESLHLQNPPENIKALYYTAYATSRTDKIDSLIKLAKNTNINAVMIDIKEIDGYISFSLDTKNFWDIQPVSNNRIKDIKNIIKKLHENNIYVIGRIVVFKDARLSQLRKDLAIKWSWDHSKVWGDYKWKSYTDPGSKEVWDYHINLAWAAYELWFDEINFDYVRFPSDGKISQTYYPKSHTTLKNNPSWGKIQTLEKFSHYMSTKLKEKHPNIILSADIFGLATHTDLKQIGQNLEAFIPYFDYVAPMIYPSHYGKWYLGFSVPDNAPYEIFDDSMKQAQKRIDALNLQIRTKKESGSGTIVIATALASDQNMPEVSLKKMRPWLQAFHCTWCPGATAYTPYKFKRQISALEKHSIRSWYVWNASSRYEASWYK